MTTPGDDRVTALRADVSSVVSAGRSFLVVTIHDAATTIVFRHKAARGLRPGAYVSCRMTPPLGAQEAVTGLLLSRSQPDPLDIADLEVERHRRAWAAQKRELDRLREQFRVLQERMAKKRTVRSLASGKKELRGKGG